MNEMTVAAANQMTPEDMMIEVLKSQKDMKQKLNDHDHKLDYLEKRQPVNPSITRELEKKRKKCVMRWLGGDQSPAYKDKSFSQKVFAEAGRDFKSMYDIPRYDLLQRKDQDDALQYWEHWEPSTNTKIEIKAKNNQTELLPQSYR